MVAENDNITIEQIINQLGNFDDIKIPSKKAARIGQALASSYPIKFPQQIQILIIEDIYTKGSD